MGSIQETPESYDMIVVGAGLAGINCLYRLQTRLPNAKIMLLEGRDDIGGAWDFFKYPGIRSDSDLFTYGFAWEPWPYDTPIAEAHLIVSYLHLCVKKYGLGKYINFQHKVTGGDWSSETKKWTLTVDNAGRRKTFVTSFVVLGTGYFDYENPLPTTIPGLDRFQGKVVHPQFWPTDYDFSTKEVVVVGSGATAITLIPNLAKQAKHITMLQRSPGYIAAVGNRGAFSWMWFLPKRVRGWLNWLHAMIIPFFQVIVCRVYPAFAKRGMLKATAKLLPANVGLDPHFTPSYNPWEQRVCLAPNGDFFQCLHEKDGQPAKAKVVTGKIKTVTEDSIACEDGQSIKADVIVTATGLKLLFGGGIPFRVDGELVNPHDHAIWDGCMLNDVPNLVFMTGYAWASWTLGVDNTAITLIRLWKKMQKRGDKAAVPKLGLQRQLEEGDREPFLLLTSTYLKKDTAFPFHLAGGQGPWKARGNVWLDWVYARCGYIGKALDLS